MIVWLAVAHAQEAHVSNVAWCFTSGLRVLFEEDHSRPEVAVRSLYEGGSGGGEPGLAHLVEHLWFQAEPDHGERVWDRLNSLGARFNAFTDRDQTMFETIVPRRKIRAVMLLEAARLESPLAGVDDASFALERNVVKNEIDAYRGEETLYAALFPPSHPYHHLPGGTEADLAELTLAQARSYAKRWYRPDQMTIHVKGDLTTEQFEKVLVTTVPKDDLVREGTDEIIEACRPRNIEVEVPEVKPQPMLRWEGDVSQRQGRIAWRYDPREDVMVDFAATLLGLRLGLSLERDADCWATPMRKAGVVQCYVELAPEEDAEGVLRKGIRISRELWQPNNRTYLDRNYDYWKSLSIGRLFRSLEEEHDLAATRFHLSGEQDWLEKELERRSFEDFSEAARIGEQTFTVKGAQLAVVEPRAWVRGEGESFHAVRRLAPPKQVDASLEHLEQVVAEPNWAPTVHRQLPNGLRVSVYPKGLTDLVRVKLVFPGGWRAGGVRDAVAWNALPDTSIQEFEAAIGLLGRWWIRRRSDAWIYEISGVSVEKQLRLLAGHLKNQKPDSQSVRSWRREDDISVGVYWRASLHRLSSLDPHGAYEPQALLDEAKTLSPKEIRSWAQGQLAPQGAHLIVVGNVDPDAVLAQARGLFGKMKTTVTPVRTSTQNAATTPEPVVFHHTYDSVQSSVVLGCRLDDAPAAVTTVTEALVRDAMFTTLREELGAVYTPFVAVERDGQGERLGIYASVEKGRAGEALAAAQKRVRGLARDIEPGELALAKLHAANSAASLLDSGRGRMSAFTSRALAGHPGTGGLATSLFGVTDGQVKAVLSTCAGHEVMSAVGPNGALEAVDAELKGF